MTSHNSSSEHTVNSSLSYGEQFEEPKKKEKKDAEENLSQEIQQCLQNTSPVTGEQILQAKNSEESLCTETQHDMLRTALEHMSNQQIEQGNNEINNILDEDPESIERLKKTLHFVDITEFGIDDTPENREAFQRQTEQYFVAFVEHIKKIAEIPEVQNAQTEEAKNTYIMQAVEKFQNENFPIYFEEFLASPNTTPFTFSDILLNAIINQPNSQKIIHESEEYKKSQEERETYSFATNNESLLSLEDADIDEYLDEEANFILRESTPDGKFSFLENGNITEPFAEVIAFVQSNGETTLSPNAYEAYINILNDKHHEKNKKWLKKEIKNVQKIHKNHDEFMRKQKKLINHETFYQLGMQRIAERAQKIIEEKDPNTQEKLYSTTDFINADNLTNKEVKLFIDSLQGKNPNSYGYTVKNKFTQHADSSLDGQITSRLTPPNFLIDQVLRSGLMLTAFANIIVAIQSGNWRRSFPLIFGSIAGIGVLANGVMNSGFEKALYPEKMLDNIVKESFNNTYYKDFFENEWEVSLAQNIDWNPKTIKKDIKKVKKGNGTVEHIYHQKADGTESRESLGLNSYDRNIKHTFEESLTINDFTDNNPMSRYLNKSHYLGPDGILYTKEEYLKKVEEHSDHSQNLSSSNNTKSNHVRYIMYEKIANRIGKKDSFIPLFNQLHGHYKHASPE